MSKKIIGIVLVVVGIALQAIPGIGQAIGLPMIAAGVSSAAVIGLALTLAGSLLMGSAKPKLDLTQNQVNRLQATLVPTTPRKILFGTTALDTDVRYEAYTGANQAYLDMIICHASHEVHSIDELWLDNEIAWTAAGGVQGRYVGYLTIQTRTVGTSGNGIAIDGTWTTSCTLTGCAYSHLQFKLTGNSSSASSPFSSGVTSRMTFRGKGAKVYDPRLDSTVAGGSGTQRASDQTTWAWDDNASRNPALQELFYELGWKINGKLAVGKGVPPARIDLASYAVGANHCDESITLNGGGTEPRYRSDGVISEGDDPGGVRDSLCATMNALLRDAGGKLSLTVIVNDLAAPVAPSGKTSFDQYDVQSELQWEQTPDLHQSFNIVRGQRIDPSNSALYQPSDYPEVSLASNDGIDRIDTFNLPLVQSNGQAQRLAKQRLQRNQYQGKLTFVGQPSFWCLSLGEPFAFSHPAFGWSGKLFRCVSQQISRTGATHIVALEENAAIYAWGNNEAAAVTPGAPTVYDPTNNALVVGINVAAVSAAPGDGNRIRFSRLEQATTGWAILVNNSSLTTFGLSGTVNLPTGKRELVLSWSYTAANQVISMGSNGNPYGIDSFRIPVNAGERIFVGAKIGTALSGGASSWSFNIGFLAADATTVISEPVIASSSTDVAFPTAVGNFMLVPAGAAYAWIELYCTSGAAGSATMNLAEPILCSAGASQTVWPAFTPGPASEPGAQITRWIDDPPQNLTFKYDYTGAAQTNEFPRDITFKLLSSSGQVTSGITWTYTVLTGNVNGFTSASGAQSMTGAGTGDMNVTSLGSSTATVKINAGYAGQTYAKTIALAQDIAPAPVSTGGGGGGGGGTTTIASASSGFQNFNSTTFVDVTGASTPLVGTMPTGKTTANVSVQLNASPNPTALSGTWTIECKLMCDVAGTPTQVGTTQSATSDWDYSNSIGDDAVFNFTIADTGLTAGTTYNWRIYMREVSGTKGHRVTGTVTVTA